MRIGLTSIYVDDQDRAERFYTEVLGFQVKTSAPYGPGERWLSVVVPEEPDGVSWCCTWPTRPRGRSSRPAGRPAGRCCRCPPTTASATPSGSRPGVVFVKEPARMAYGGMDAVFADTCGNLLNLHQD